MDPMEGAQAHMAKIAELNQQQVLFGKKASALEIERIEGELVVARARVQVAEAEIAVIRANEAATPAPTPEAAKLTEARIAAATALRDAHQGEVEALTSYLETKNKLAELALELDPNVMGNLMQMITFDPFADDDDDDTSGGPRG
jgi:hypothetical protein